VRFSLQKALAETEIDQLQLTVDVLVDQHEVFGFEISVANALCVQMLQRGEHLSHVVLGVCLVKAFVSNDKVEEFATRAQLRHDVHESLIDVGLKELDDVGVVHLLQDIQLLLEVLDVLLERFQLN